MDHVTNAPELNGDSYSIAYQITDQIAFFQLIALHNDDTDADGLPDSWEISQFGSITAESGVSDYDGDGIVNIEEFQNGTRPSQRDDREKMGASSRKTGIVITEIHYNPASGPEFIESTTATSSPATSPATHSKAAAVPSSTPFPSAQKACWNVPAKIDAYFDTLMAQGIWPAGQQPDGVRAGVKNWITNRRAYISSQLSANDSPFEITSNAGNNFTTSQHSYSLTGTAPFSVVRFTTGTPETDQPVTWEFLDSGPIKQKPGKWTLIINLAPGPNIITVKGYDKSDTLMGTDSITITLQ
jgi:hypothetical protein